MTIHEAKAIAKDHTRLKENLTKIRKQIGREVLAAAADMSCQTWSNRMKNPGEFTYDELQAISRVAGVDFVELTTGTLGLR